MTTEQVQKPLDSGKRYRVGVVLNELDGSPYVDNTYMPVKGDHRKLYAQSGKTQLFDRDSNNRPVLLYTFGNKLGPLACQYQAATELLNSISEERLMLERIGKRWGAHLEPYLYDLQVQKINAWRLEAAEAFVAYIDDQLSYLESLEAYWLYGTPYKTRRHKDCWAHVFGWPRAVEEARQLLASNNTNETNN